MFLMQQETNLLMQRLKRPLHLSVATWNVAVVKRWVEVATPDEIAEAIDIPNPIGIALCMAAASKKDHEIGTGNWNYFLIVI
ncbi:hypothetical protein QN277_019088 [Acacia crassicarpa]|uniref:Uncharacterized protein n=1 Tax=Acacia crassicarpa TaxID=499986 RepID=A0AAE1MS70_9FABA|nr:hypothetical protein QN277_019088 [Acacia crassicarpa]